MMPRLELKTAVKIIRAEKRKLDELIATNDHGAGFIDGATRMCDCIEKYLKEACENAKG